MKGRAGATRTRDRLPRWSERRIDSVKILAHEPALGDEIIMKCRRTLGSFSPSTTARLAADSRNTALMKLKNAILALKNPALHPSQLITRPDVAADIANIFPWACSARVLHGQPATTIVWAHHQVMMQGPNDPFGPKPGSSRTRLRPWHRELLKLLRGRASDAAAIPNLTLPYWDWKKDQSAADPASPSRPSSSEETGQYRTTKVTTGDFSQAADGC